MTEKLKLDDRKIKEHISSWSYETRDRDGNIIVRQKIQWLIDEQARGNQTPGKKYV